ncbi:hypothetical protein AA23498_1899 [Acetobacter nitrogenifigens DSM 23921 = NBRC 105050]|nr:hypothetical protein AA23498_1899 [Acetobacter nitrogenifigens DSM 23921 = NBRC 105050]
MLNRAAILRRFVRRTCTPLRTHIARAPCTVRCVSATGLRRITAPNYVIGRVSINGHADIAMPRHLGRGMRAATHNFIARA